METEAAPPATLDEALADISLRFLANLPQGDKTTVERLFMQIQQAHWFYEDFYVDEYGHIPHLGGGEFARLLFERCPLLFSYKYDEKFMGAFKNYLHSIPVCGAVMLNPSLTHVLLVRSWNRKSWSFPRGKVNQGEPLVDCAAREAEEETGYNPRSLLHPDRWLQSTTSGQQSVTMFLAPGCPDDGSVEYAPLARKEVSEVAWWDLDGIPTASGEAGASRFWAVREFMRDVRAWVRQAHSSGRDLWVERNAESGVMPGAVYSKASRGKPPAGAGGGKGGARGGGGGGGGSARKLSGNGGGNTAGSGAGSGGSGSGGLGSSGGFQQLEAAADGSGGKGWSVNDMFKANERLLGVRFMYDGNPHTFGDASVQARPTGAAAAATGAQPVNAFAAGQASAPILSPPSNGAGAARKNSGGGGKRSPAAAAASAGAGAITSPVPAAASGKKKKGKQGAPAEAPPSSSAPAAGGTAGGDVDAATVSLRSLLLRSAPTTGSVPASSGASSAAASASTTPLAVSPLVMPGSAAGTSGAPSAAPSSLHALLLAGSAAAATRAPEATTGSAASALLSAAAQRLQPSPLVVAPAPAPSPAVGLTPSSSAFSLDKAALFQALGLGAPRV